jgi:hypothetical protein
MHSIVFIFVQTKCDALRFYAVAGGAGLGLNDPVSFVLAIRGRTTGRTERRQTYLPRPEHLARPHLR